MGYTDKIKNQQGTAHNISVARTILDLLGKLRKSTNENNRRRWIWELLQNAKDVGYKESSVSIKINLYKDKDNSCLEFTHNGRPFTSKDIVFLIEQVSTKDREKSNNEIETVGKFGTGFLSTHLLSEKTTIRAVLKDEDEVYKQFELELDRSGRSTQEINQSVEHSIDSLNNIDQIGEYLNYKSVDFNTKFIYNLDEKGEKIAEIGIGDLTISLPYTLAFISKIESVYITHQDILYKRKKEITLYENITLISIIKEASSGDEYINIVKVEEDNLSILIEVDKVNNIFKIKPLNPKLPKLFCIFPLIGTEDFNIPFTINSPSFNPTEPRDGVFLSDVEDNEISQNKALILKAVKLYYKLINFGANEGWKDIYLLAKIGEVQEKEWLSESWFRNNVLKPVRETLLTLPIVDTETGERQTILNEDGKPNIWFPSANQKEVREKIWSLAKKWIPSSIPQKSDFNSWHSIIWDECKNLTLKVIAISIESRKSLEIFGNELSKEVNSIDWVNRYYELLALENIFIEEIINDKHSVFPNQNGTFKKRTELHWDRNIDEKLKDALTILKTDIRDSLIHKSVIVKIGNVDTTKNMIKFNEKNQVDIIELINKVIRDGQNENISNACDFLVSCFSDNDNFPTSRSQLYGFCCIIFKSDYLTKNIIDNWQSEIWQEVDKFQIGRLVKTIADLKNISNLSDHAGFGDLKYTLNWLNSFITFLIENKFDHLLADNINYILPNQNGDFMPKDILYLDSGDIDDELKVISVKLGIDCKSELLDKAIYLELPLNRVRDLQFIADHITESIKVRLSEMPRSLETIEIFERLIVWFNNNKEVAQVAFSDLYKNRLKLYDEDKLAESILRKEQLDHIMEEFKIKDVEELIETLRNNKYKNNKEEEITSDLLISLGVTTQLELQKALEDNELSSGFMHTSTTDYNLFLLVQELIHRAKASVRSYLETLPEYDCSDWEEIATTVIGGVKKNEVPIYLVIRPSDNKEVIIYYGSERDILEQADTELWIEDGISTPIILTLGKILKNTGINRIPLIDE